MSRTQIKLPDRDKWNSADADVQYDPGFVAYLGMIFDPSRACVDVGANVGKVTRFLAARTTRPIWAFEPAPTTFACLKENVGALHNVTLVNKAVAHAVRPFRFVGEGTTTAHVSTGRQTGACVRVEGTTLDASIPSDLDVGLIKIDVEGSEACVLVGATQTIQRCRPLLAIEVIDGHLRRFRTTRGSIFSLVESWGYVRAVNKYGMREYPNKPTGAADIFFLPSADWYAPNLRIGYERLATRSEAEQSDG